MPVPSLIPSLLIVVPTLDSHALLPRLLASLQEQSWPHWRLLFVDGPSGPRHRQWLEQCCAAEPRCRWIPQDPAEPGIFGAMNQGFAAAGPGDWLLFWGSDDWTAAPTVLAEAMAVLRDAGEPLAGDPAPPDLLVCRGRYADAATGVLGRPTAFRPGAGSGSLLDAAAFRRALLFGSTPPHQATLFGPGARARLACYAPGFRLAADLDYFLKLSALQEVRVQCLDLELVHMAVGGVSGRHARRRLLEVRRAYRHAFGGLWWLPFLVRYLRRLASLLLRR